MAWKPEAPSSQRSKSFLSAALLKCLLRGKHRQAQYQHKTWEKMLMDNRHVKSVAGCWNYCRKSRMRCSESNRPRNEGQRCYCEAELPVRQKLADSLTIQRIRRQVNAGHEICFSFDIRGDLKLIWIAKKRMMTQNSFICERYQRHKLIWVLRGVAT